MDNFKIDMVIRRKVLKHALKIVFSQHHKAVGFKKTSKEFILFWTDDDKATKLPVEMNAEQIEPIILAWLDEADYGECPDIDGSVKKEAVRVSCDDWGHVEPYGWTAFVRIEPVWALYGK